MNSSLIAMILGLKSHLLILQISNMKCFQSKEFQFPFSRHKTKKQLLPLKVPEEDEEDKEEATASHAGAKG